jgi:NADH:ubiquinone oxidoreductase subunit E
VEKQSREIHDIAHRYGLTEHEAQILHHLDQATQLYKRLPDHENKYISSWLLYREALSRLLMLRVVKRDHPEGWLTEAEEEYRELAEE